MIEYNNYVPKSRAELKSIAKGKLKGNWLNAIMICLVVVILTNGANISISLKNVMKYGTEARGGLNIGQLLQLILGGPLALGLASYFLKLLRGDEARIEEAFSGFNNFASAFLVQLLSAIFIFLWTILLVVPGIIAALNYSMIFYILKDNPDLSAMDVLKESKKLMDGDKVRLFVLGLSFIGWFLLSAVTFGILLIWIIPYVNATMAAFYEDLKERKLVKTEDFQDNKQIYSENP